MKKFSLCVILFLATFPIAAQDITVSFQPKVSGTQIDSVWVNNLRTNQKVKLLGSESLLLTWPTGIPDLQVVQFSGRLFPNPVYGDATLLFPMGKTGVTVVGIYNSSGQLLNQQNRELHAGLHRFRITLPVAGIYYISIISSGTPLVFKAVCAGVPTQETRILYEGIESKKYFNTPNRLKSERTAKTMVYSLGDVLLSSSFSGKNNTILADSPTATKVYAPEFFECIDGENQSYPVVRIGQQVWMAKNLQTTKFLDLSLIPEISDNATWEATTTGAFCWYNNDMMTYKNIYGALYNWFAINTEKLCPIGWHLPTDDEWTILEIYLQNNGYNYDGSVDTDSDRGTNNKIGKSLASTTYWNLITFSGVVGNTDYPSIRNKSGFSALPGGSRANNGTFSNLGGYGSWWSSSVYLTSFIWCRFLQSDSNSADRIYKGKNYGLSVRCIRDLLPTVTTVSVTNINQISSTSGGNISSDGMAAVTSRGVCWSITSTPTISDNKTTNGTGIGVYSSAITGLTANTVYYVRAYATNSLGTAYGGQVQFTTLKDIVLPSVTTAAPSLVLAASAILGGNVTGDGNGTVTERGICWDTAQNPTIAGNKVAIGSGAGAFSNKITGLTTNTTYYARAYAINSKGAAYGNEVSFNNPAGTFTDNRDQRVYKWIQIGTQKWMAENLDYLPVVYPGTKSEVDKYYYVYGYNGSIVSEAKATENYQKYGVLYNWAAAMNGASSGNNVPSGIQGICPSGWHLPSAAEWEILYNYLETSGGGKLKEAGASNWRTPNTLATNESGFTARAGGYMSGSGSVSSPGLFTNQFFIATFWSTKKYEGSSFYINAYRFFLSNNSGDLNSQSELALSGISVRCIKD